MYVRNQEKFYNAYEINQKNWFTLTRLKKTRVDEDLISKVEKFENSDLGF
jgi:hypothetical protein